MSLSELKPVAKSTLWGTIVGAVGGFLVGGPAGAMAGANFCGSVGAQVGLYNKGEDLAERAAQNAGREFREIAHRVSVNLEENINRVANKLMVATEKAANAYSKAAITGYAASWALQLSGMSGQYGRDFCVSEKEWMQCNAFTLATIGFLGVSVFTAIQLYKDILKLREEGLFHVPNRTIPNTATTTTELETETTGTGAEPSQTPVQPTVEQPD